MIHTWQYHEFGDADHKATFTRWTDHLDTSRHCERFTTPKWWLVCEDCDGQIARYRCSKTLLMAYFSQPNTGGRRASTIWRKKQQISTNG
jgi:hypothetical protein